MIEADLFETGSTFIVSRGEVDAEGKMIFFGTSHSGNVLLYVGNGDQSCLRDPRDFVFVIPSTEEELKNNIVDPMLHYATSISNELIQHPATFTPSGATSDKLEIDTMDFPPDATIYIDGDSIADYFKAGKLVLNKQHDQVIVFNFDSTDTLELEEFYCRYDRNDPLDEAHRSSTPTTKGEKNDWIDDLAQHVVWNLNSVSNVTLSSTTGMILLPKTTSEANVTGTSSGWIVTNGKFENSGGEWHSVYKKMPDVTTTNLQVRKTVDGKVPAGVQKFNFKLDHLITTQGTRYWNPMIVEGEGEDAKYVKTNTNGSVQFDGIKEMEDGFNVYRITEVSVAEGTAGNYVLDERHIYAVVDYHTFYNGAGVVKIAGTPHYYMEITDGETPNVYFSETMFNRTAETETGAFADGAGAPDAIGLKRVTSPTFHIRR